MDHKHSLLGACNRGAPNGDLSGHSVPVFRPTSLGRVTRDPPGLYGASARDNIVTVSFPGIMATRGQLSRYVGAYGVEVACDRSVSDTMTYCILSNYKMRTCSSERESAKPPLPSPRVSTNLIEKHFFPNGDKYYYWRHENNPRLFNRVQRADTAPWSYYHYYGQGCGYNCSLCSNRSQQCIGATGDISCLTGPLPDSYCRYRVVCRHAPLLLHGIVPLPETEETIDVGVLPFFGPGIDGNTRDVWGCLRRLLSFSSLLLSSFLPLLLSPHHWPWYLKSALIRWYYRMPGLPLTAERYDNQNIGGWKDQGRCYYYLYYAIAKYLGEDIESIALEKRAKHREQRGAARSPETTPYNSEDEEQDYYHSRALDKDQSNEEGNENAAILSGDGRYKRLTCIPYLYQRYHKPRCRQGRKYLALFGFSRGATTVVQTALKCPRRLARHIDMIIAEAPFADLSSVLRDSSWCPRLQLAAARCFADIDRSDDIDAPFRLPPLADVHLRPGTVFIFVTSECDRRVPRHNTLSLINAMKRQYQGYFCYEHLTLRRSRHGGMTHSDEEDIYYYREFMEYCYKKYCPQDTND